MGKEVQRQLASERLFLQYLGQDFERASHAMKTSNYLYVYLKDGTSYRYHYKPVEQRLDKGTRNAGGISYLGRITAGVNLTKFSYEVDSFGVSIQYSLGNGPDREMFFRFKAQ
ncbi:hypothetical protein BHU72_02130 [Desulfuribacillus stibiiarsenatis]|uniref:Uncharacterized protein n=2 Tax=Desulfuribacillus stibiiarsenatis TaxID=1390249 RepID=A0A1E5L663_9FIRM|nr:hypothetical protein BHU72_02130 [Desulfuribacillus stibiiarsenatis]